MARETLGDLLINIRGDTQQLIKSFNNAENTVKKASANMVKSIAKITAGYLALDSVVSGLQKTVNDSLQFDTVVKRLKFATDSTDDFKESIRFLEEESNKLGINILQAGASFGKFAGATKGTKVTFEETKEIFLAISKAGIALGISNDDLQGTFRALEQIMSKGKVQAEELRGQLGERLTGAFRLASESMGVSTSQLDKMLQSGEVLAEDFLPKFGQTIDKTFSKVATESLDDAQRAFTRLDNAIVTLRVSIAKSGLVDAIVEMANTLEFFVKENGAEIVEAFKDLGRVILVVGNAFNLVRVSAQAYFATTSGNIEELETLRKEFDDTLDSITDLFKKLKQDTTKEYTITVTAKAQIDPYENFTRELEKELKKLRDKKPEGFSLDKFLSSAFDDDFSKKIEKSLFKGFYDFANGGSFRSILRSIGDDVGNAVGGSISKSLGSGAIGAIGGGIAGGLVSYGISKVSEKLFGSKSSFNAQEVANNRLEDIYKELQDQTDAIKEGFSEEGEKFSSTVDFLTSEINKTKSEIDRDKRIMDAIREIQTIKATSGDGNGGDGDRSGFGGTSSGGGGSKIDYSLLSDATKELIKEFPELSVGLGDVSARNRIKVSLKVQEDLQKKLNEALEEGAKVTSKNTQTVENLFLTEDELIKKSLELSGSTKEIPQSYEELLTVIEDLKQSNGILTDSETSLIQQLKERIDTNIKLKESELDLSEARETVSNSLERQINQQIALFNAYEDTQTSIQGTIREITNTKISIEEITEAIKNISSPEKANKTLGLINTYFQEQKDIARETIDIEKETLKKRIDLLEIEEDVLRSFSDFAFNIRTSQLESSLQTTALKEKFDLALEETKEAILQGDPDVQLLGDRVLNFGEAYLSSLKDTAKTSEELEFEQKRTALLLESFTGTGDNATILDLKNELISLSDDSSEDLKIQEQVESLLAQLNQETQNQQDIIETNILSLQSDIRSYLDSDSPLVEAVKSITEELKNGSWLSEISSSLTQNQKDFNDAVNKISQGEKKLIDGIEVTVVDGVPTATVTGATKPTIVEPIESGSSGGSKIFSQPVKSITGQTINTSTTSSQTSGISLATTSGFSSLSEVYKSVLGRDVDPSGAKSWGDAISSGKLSLDEAASAISKSLEAQKKGVIPFAKGGYVKGGHGGVLGLVGEGEHDELITPLKDDPLNIGEVASKIDKMGNILLRLQSTNERLLTATLDIAGTNADIALEMSN